MSCGPLPGEATTPLRALRGNRAVIEGVVVRDGELVPGAYVRLLDSPGDFVAEVQTDWAGRFRFYTAAGEWVLRVLAPAAEVVNQSASVDRGQVLAVEIWVAG